MLVYGYCRVSTWNQKEHGSSLAEQEQQIIEYCKAQGHTLVEIFRDEAKSGAGTEDDMITGRDGYISMIGSIRRNNIQAIMVLSTSRLWRSEQAKYIVHRELKRLGCDVIAIDRPSYTIYRKDPSDIIVNGMLELIDSYEREEIRVKLSRGRMRKASSGEYAGGGVKYGYRLESTIEIVDGKQVKCSRLVPHSDEELIVRMVFTIRKDFPECSMDEIAKALNSEGYKTRNQAKFNRVHIKRILDSEDFYKGLYTYGGITSQGVHEPLID